MAGREDEYTRGFIHGVSSMMDTLIEKTSAEPVDKAIIIGYAKYVIEQHIKEGK